MAAVHGYTVAFTVSAALFGVGAVVAVLLLPSRRRLEELRALAQTAGAAPAISQPPVDSLSSDGAIRAAEPH